MTSPRDTQKHAHRWALHYQAGLSVPPFAAATWLRPVGISRAADPAASGPGFFPLAGGALAFHQLDVVMAGGAASGPQPYFEVWRCSVAELLAACSSRADRAIAEAWLDRVTRPRPPFAGLSMTGLSMTGLSMTGLSSSGLSSSGLSSSGLEMGKALARPHIMGILNVTPDSFSDGGQNYAAETALAHARQMAAEGAAILDIGGESTRPGADPVSRDEELARIRPVIRELAAEGLLVSADTRHSAVMEAAHQAGACIINDVGGFRDAGAADLMARQFSAQPENAFAIAMHMQGEPGTMQKDPHYRFAPLDVYEWLAERIAVLEAAGLPRSHIAVDPGFGFGKTVADNLALISWAGLLHGLGVPVLIGASRKSSIGMLDGGAAADQRLGGSLALACRAAGQGAQMIRVHDVPETRQALTVWQAG